MGPIARTGLAAAAVLAGFAAAGAAQQRIDPLTADPARRGALLALPSVYRVEARFEVAGLRLGNGTLLRLPAGPGRLVTELGTAFAVSPDGVLASAAHVAAPGDADLARAVAPLALAQRGEQGLTQEYVRNWVQLNDVRPVGVRVRSVRVWQATPDPASPRVEFPARPVPGGRSLTDDLVLLRIPARGVPAVELDESMTAGTPVATIGFGTGEPFAQGLDGPPVPTVRIGRLGRSAPVTLADTPDQVFTVVTTRVHAGDSGGPAVGADGRVHGIVRWSSVKDGGIVVQAARLRILMRRAGVSGGEGPSGVAFREGLEDLWRADVAGASDALGRARAAYPAHALAGVEQARAKTLLAAGVGPRSQTGRRALLLALASVFALASAACWVRLLRTRGRPPSRPPAGTPAPARPPVD